MRRDACIAAVFAMLAVGSAAQQTAPSPPSPKQGASKIIFHMADQLLSAAKYQVANGVVVRRADWPTLMMAKIPGNGKKATSCTGALVGPTVVLMAAHCVDTWAGKPRPAQVVAYGQLLDMDCAMHPDYTKAAYNGVTPRSSHDFALCHLKPQSNEQLPQFLQKLSYEVVDAERVVLQASPVLMIGYGCTKLRVSPLGGLTWDPSDGELSLGDSLTDRPARHWAAEPAYLTIRADPKRDYALCPGDSGGPLFTGVTAKEPNGPRRISGVNSRVCSQLNGEYSTACGSKPQEGSWTLISSISVASAPEFRSWAENWLGHESRKDAVICGLNRKAGEAPCRH